MNFSISSFDHPSTDEVHSIIGAGAGGENDSMNAANILKPALANGQVQLVGTTTIKEYRKYIEKDTALERRFQPVMVDEPSTDDSSVIPFSAANASIT